jgi:FAD/FMN-containing dehydrogenase
MSYLSWGRYPLSTPAKVVPLRWLSDLPDLGKFPEKVLARGEGRSYGDVCLNQSGVLLDTRGLDHFIHFDQQTGILRCEAGVTFREILCLVMPLKWFLPVTPGTQFVTIAGAVANDVHGKNHHRASSFGRHVIQLELLRSDGEQVLCSSEKNSDLFHATIGGLGLTGLILWVEIQLMRVPGSTIECEQIRFQTLDEFFEISSASDKTHDYTVAWLDCVCPSTRHKLGRGLFMRGKHSALAGTTLSGSARSSLAKGFDAPESLINRTTVRAFNELYFRRQLRDFVRNTVSVESFFYPLDKVVAWNKLYGRRGFLQYQFVVPYERRKAVQNILDLIQRSPVVCALAVLKVFGTSVSSGILSFPRPGVTLALDFPFQGRSSLELCEQFDEVVRANNGAVYPAKDARMSAESFRDYFPAWRSFLPFQDPQFSSDFWRRVAS